MSVTYYNQRRVFSPPAEWEYHPSYVYHNTNIVFHEGRPDWYSYNCEVMTYEEYGQGGTSNYNALSNKPQVNGITLMSNKTPSELKLVGKSENSASTAINIGITANQVPFMEI